jgi:hypothetical protein
MPGTASARQAADNLNARLRELSRRNIFSLLIDTFCANLAKGRTNVIGVNRKNHEIIIVRQYCNISGLDVSETVRFGLQFSRAMHKMLRSNVLRA